MSDPNWADILFVCQAQTTAGETEHSDKHNKTAKYAAAGKQSAEAQEEGSDNVTDTLRNHGTFSGALC